MKLEKIANIGLAVRLSLLGSLAAAMLVLALVSCNNCPPCDSCCPACPECDSCCPACPECLECPDGYELVKEPLIWRCEPLSTEPRPEDYYMLSHAGTFADGWKRCREHTGMVEDICVGLCPSECWRDPQYVAVHCPWGCLGGSDPLFDLTSNEMFKFGEIGHELHEAGKKWMTKLPKMNRRGDPSHPDYDPRFEKRSDVRKTNYPDGSKPAFKSWQEAFAIHKAQAYAFRYAAQSDPIRAICGFDSTKGWCQCRNKYGGAQ